MKTDALVKTVLELTREEYLVESAGLDGKLYAIRPFVWTIEAVEKYSGMYFRFGVLSDDIPKTIPGFLSFVMAPGTLWFEVLSVRDKENVGFICISDLLPSGTENRFISATFHAITWDAKAGRRLELAKAFIRYIFKAYRLHRLVAAVPLRFGGAIRITKKLGFKEEGVLRSARRFKGEWFGVLALSIIEDEVQNG